MSNDNTFKNFKNYYHSISKQSLDEESFLRLASRAISAYKEDPSMREDIARIMTGIWISNLDVEEGSEIDLIGGEFADLELPDAHIDISDFSSVEEKWGALEKKIDQAISSRKQ